MSTERRRRYQYAFSCIDGDAAAKLKNGLPISYDRTRRLLGPQLIKWATEHDYFERADQGPTLRQCTDVLFYKGWRGQQPAIWLTWSRLFFVWLAKSEWRRNKSTGAWHKDKWSLTQEYNEKCCLACQRRMPDMWSLTFNGERWPRDFATMRDAKALVDSFDGIKESNIVGLLAHNRLGL